MATFDSHRKLTRSDLLPILGVGAAVGAGTGLVAAYVTRVFLMRKRISGGRDAGNAEQVHQTPEVRVTR